MMIDFKYLWPKYGINPTTVLHLGANEGQEAKTYNDLGVKNVIWVEGHRPTYEKLVENTKGYPNTKCIQACVSDRYSETYFNVSNNGSQSSSLLELGHHKIIHPEVSFIEKIPVKTFRIDDILKDEDFEGDCFLNADLQGGELPAIKGMGGLLNKFKWAYLEVNKKNVYEGCALVDEVDKYLLGYDFVRAETGDWVQDSWTDALYIKA